MHNTQITIDPSWQMEIFLTILCTKTYAPTLIIIFFQTQFTTFSSCKINIFWKVSLFFCDTCFQMLKMTINLASKEEIDCCDDGPYKIVPPATNKRTASLADDQVKLFFETCLNHLTFQKFATFFPTLKQQNFLPYNTLT